MFLIPMHKTAFSIILSCDKLVATQSMKVCHKVTNVCHFLSALNMSYLTDLYIVFTLKMESVYKNTIFGLKMMVKSGLEKFILKSLHAGSSLPHGGISKLFFLDHFSPSFLGQKLYFWIQIPF